MSFNRNFKGKKGDGLSSGAFKSKSGEVYVAKFTGEWFTKLIKVVKEAKDGGNGVVLFIRKNDKRKTDKDPHLKVSIAVDKPFKKNAIKSGGDELDPGLDDSGDFDGDTEDTDFN